MLILIRINILSDNEILDSYLTTETTLRGRNNLTFIEYKTNKVIDVEPKVGQYITTELVCDC